MVPHQLRFGPRGHCHVAAAPNREIQHAGWQPISSGGRRLGWAREFGSAALFGNSISAANEKHVAEELGARQQQGTRMVLIKAIEVGRDLWFDSFYLFHGNLRFPVAKYTVDEIRHVRPEPPVLGVCVTRDFPVVREVYPNVRVQYTRAQFILWRVDPQPGAS